MNATVYSKPACTNCTATYRALDKKAVSYEKIDMSVDPEAMDFVMSLGASAAPFIVIRDAAGEIIDTWGGFRPDKIMEHVDQLPKAELATV